MPGKTGAHYCVFSPVHGAYQLLGLSHPGSPVNGAGRKSSGAVREPGVNAGPNTAARKPRERGKPASSNRATRSSCRATAAHNPYGKHHLHRPRRANGVLDVSGVRDQRRSLSVHDLLGRVHAQVSEVTERFPDRSRKLNRCGKGGSGLRRTGRRGTSAARRPSAHRQPDNKVHRPLRGTGS
jgi:hypothetical protein